MAIKIISLSGYIGSGKNLFCSILQQQLKIPSKGYSGPIYGDIWHQKAHATKLKMIASLLLNIPLHKFEDQEFKKTDLGPEWDRSISNAQQWLHMKGLINIHSNVTVYREDEIVKKAKEAGFKFTRTVREFMQELGTDSLRYNLHPDVWMNAMWCDYRPVPTINTHSGGHRILQDWQALPEDPNWIITDSRFDNELTECKRRGGILVRIDRFSRASDHASEVTIDNWKDWDYRVDNTGTLLQLHDKAKEFIHYFNL